MSGDKSTKDWKKVREAHESQEDKVLDDLIEETEAVEKTEEMEETDEADVGGSALEHPSYSELEEQLTLAEQKAHEHWEKSTRAVAELENFRRRATRDIENAHRFGLEKFIDSLLPVIDSLEQALQLASQDDNQSMHEGLELTMKLFLDVLQKHHVEQIDPEGERFDPQQHEAMSMQPSAEVPPQTVLTVFQKGYQLNERIVRPARVIVSKEP